MENKLDIVVKQRNSPEQILWSKEVILCVAKSTTDKGSRAKVNVRRLPEKEGGKSGTSLFKSIGEADIRTKTEDKLLKKIQEVPLKKRYSPLIVQDVIRAFDGRFVELSLKTFWLVLREYSKSVRDHEEEAMTLFCGPCQALANLTFASPDLMNALKEVLNTDLVPQRFTRFLLLMANQAVKLSFLQSNPVECIWKEIAAEDTRILNKITEELRDWSFNDAEMDRMTLPLLESVRHADGKIRPIYETNSHALMKLFILFTLMHKNELCALKFGDIEFFSNGDASVLVTKYLDHNGKIKYYDGGGRQLILRRKTVLVRLLTECVKARMKYVMSNLEIGKKEIGNIHIFFEKEVSNKAKAKGISMKTANCLYDELIECAKENKATGRRWKLALNDGEVVKYIDIGVSRSTEFVFINNLKIWAESIAGLESGELAYNSGVNPVETIDLHYTGWYVVFNQVATAGKLDRLSARYLSVLFPANQQPLSGTIKIEGPTFSQTWIPPADKHGRVYLRIPASKDTSIHIKNNTQYGHATEVTLYEEKT